MIKQNTLKFNTNHIWHAYDSMKKPLPCYIVDSAQGIHLKFNTGIKVIDGISSWWSAIHGYNHHELNQALKNQINKISHVMFGGLVHKPAIQLCKELLKILPKKLECIFLCDSGSIAIEIAMKMVIQYWGINHKNRKLFLTIKNGYHGDTFSGVSVCYLNNKMYSFYNKIIPKYLFATGPKVSFYDKWDDNDCNSFVELINKNQSKILGVILEPIVQGVGGMKFYHPEYLKKVELLCKKYHIPLIIDEIATGFGRTGKMFAYQYSNIIPDILCIGKALTGGVMTLSATITSKKIANQISKNYPYKLMHGSTFMANALACSVAYSNLCILKRNEWKNQVNAIELYFKKNLPILLHHPRIIDVRVLGGIAVIECYHNINLKLIQIFFVNYGVWLRPYKNIIYIIPPYIIKKYHLSRLFRSIIEVIKHNEFFKF